MLLTCRKRATGAPWRQHWWVWWQASTLPPDPPTGPRGGETPPNRLSRGIGTPPPLLCEPSCRGDEEVEEEEAVKPLLVPLERMVERVRDSTSEDAVVLMVVVEGTGHQGGGVLAS